MAEPDLTPVIPTRLEPPPPWGKARAMGIDIPMGRDVASCRRRIEAMERLLEGSLVVPGMGRKVGLDAIAGLVPVFGDLITAAMGAYIVWEARNLGMSRWHLVRMGGNVAFDSAIGAIPLLGDAFDFFYRSNSRNLAIIRRYMDKHHPETRLIEQ